MTRRDLELAVIGAARAWRNAVNGSPAEVLCGQRIFESLDALDAAPPDPVAESKRASDASIREYEMEAVEAGRRAQSIEALRDDMGTAWNELDERIKALERHFSEDAMKRLLDGTIEKKIRTHWAYITKHDEAIVRGALEAAASEGEKAEEPGKCWTCSGTPHASGCVCICGGSGLHTDEVDGLRKAALGTDLEWKAIHDAARVREIAKEEADRRISSLSMHAIAREQIFGREAELKLMQPFPSVLDRLAALDALVGDLETISRAHSDSLVALIHRLDRLEAAAPRVVHIGPGGGSYGTGSAGGGFSSGGTGCYVAPPAPTPQPIERDTYDPPSATPPETAEDLWVTAQANTNPKYPGWVKDDEFAVIGHIPFLDAIRAARRATLEEVRRALDENDGEMHFNPLIDRLLAAPETEAKP